jgi:hypothetical protein
MGEGKRRLAFYEIDTGRFAQEMQVEFERAQKLAAGRRGKVTLTAKITLSPPDIEEERFGELMYEISVKAPARKSRRLTTEISNGMIVATGGSPVDVLQESIRFEDLQEPTQFRVTTAATGE